MARKGFYHDPFARSFARFHSGIAWTHIVTDELGVEQYLFDQDIDNERFKAPSPKESDCLEGKTITADNFPLPDAPTHLYQWLVVSEENVDLPNSSVGINGNAEIAFVYSSGEWVKGFNSQARLRNDSVEISSFATKSRSALLLSSFQDIANAGTRIIPLRTIQAVHFHPAARGGMGTIQFAVPGSLTGQARNNSGKVLSLLGGDVRVQSHENSISFELSQQVNFEAFHSEIVERIGNLELSGPKTSPELSNHISQLRELKLLLDDGILTPDEFESAKQAILKKL